MAGRPVVQPTMTKPKPLNQQKNKFLWSCPQDSLRMRYGTHLPSSGCLPLRQEMRPVRGLAPIQDLTLGVMQKHFTLDEISVGEGYAKKNRHGIR